MESTSPYTAGQLVEAAGRLPDVELNEFVRQVLRLDANRRAPSLPARETELLQAIFAESCQQDFERYQELLKKRDAQDVSSQELEELLSLSDQIEVVHARRMASIAEMARLRGISLLEMMTQLGVNVQENEI
jgi:hypothetical protein